MRKILLVLMSICMLAFVVGCGNDASKTTDSAKPSTSEKITIQAAASLKGALTELADAYKKEHNLADDQITINFAGSGTLRQQIEQGAPASLFISADEKNMKMLQVKAVTASISQAAGDAGFIYKTDAIAAGDAVEIAAVTPADSHDPVIYPIGIIKKYDNALAQDFYTYVMSPEGQKVLEKYGFSTTK